MLLVKELIRDALFYLRPSSCCRNVKTVKLMALYMKLKIYSVKLCVVIVIKWNSSTFFCRIVQDQRSCHFTHFQDLVVHPEVVSDRV